MIKVALLTFVIGFILIFVVYYINLTAKNKKSKSIMDSQYERLSGFMSNRKIEHKNFIFAIDYTNYQIAVVDKNMAKIIPFKDISEVKYLEDKKDVVSYKSDNRKIVQSVAMFALVGFALFDLSSNPQIKTCR